VIVAVTLVLTLVVVTENVVLVAPTGITMLAGTVTDA
jgi:hypothetical protein